MTQRSRAEIFEEVDELADVVLKYEPDLSPEAARAVVWLEMPDLYAEYGAAPVDSPAELIAKSEREERTLGDEIYDVVRKRASHLAWTHWPAKTLEDLMIDLWETPEGAALYSLYASPDGRLPLSQVEHRITKASRTSDAWAVLAKWRAG